MFCNYCGKKIENKDVFCCFCGKQLKEKNSTDLAYELFNFYTEGQFAEQVKQILNEYTQKGEKYPDRQDIFLKAIDLIGEPNTPKEKYIVAEAYLWSRYPFKLKGIEYGNKYISGELWKQNYEGYIVPKNAEDTLQNKKNIEISHFLHEIGLIYESEYRLEDALENYTEEIKLVPFWAIGYIDTVKVLIKLNRSDEALELLNSARKSKYYIPYSTKTYEWQTEQINNDFQDTIEKAIKDIEKKIEKNYKYKPKPSKCILERMYYENLSELQKKYLQEYIEKGLVIIK